MDENSIDSPVYIPSPENKVSNNKNSSVDKKFDLNAQIRNKLNQSNQFSNNSMNSNKQNTQEMPDNEEVMENSTIKNSIDLPNHAYKNILMKFEVYSILNEDDLQELKNIFPDKSKIEQFLIQMLQISDENIRDLTKLEVFILLTSFAFNNKFTNNEICCMFSIFWDVMKLDFRKQSKIEVFELFKAKVLLCSMDRPPFQIGIFKKQTIILLSDFFIDNIFTKFELLTFLTTEKKMIELNNEELFNYSLPHTLDLEMGEEVLPRKNKILKQYYESKKPKSELEQKIELIMEFERDRLDKKLEETFKEQDDAFNKKVDELTIKKKK